MYGLLWDFPCYGFFNMRLLLGGEPKYPCSHRRETQGRGRTCDGRSLDADLQRADTAISRAKFCCCLGSQKLRCSCVKLLTTVRDTITRLRYRYGNLRRLVSWLVIAFHRRPTGKC